MTDPKAKILTIRVHEQEYEFIKRKAKDNNQSLSSYLREKIFFDLPLIEPHSFEYKALKALSYCVGVLGVTSSNMSDDHQKLINDEVVRIMKANGINPNQN